MIRILVADDHAVVREGVKRIVEETDDMVIVGEASNGQDAVELAKKTHPSIILLDVSMPGKGGLETLKDLRRLNPDVRVLVLSVHPEDHYAVRFLRDGADGYMTKEGAPVQLVGAIRRICRGGKYVSPELAERLVFSLDSDLERPPHEQLSDREYEVMCSIGAGRTVKEIGEQLGLSVKTISTYRTRILQKMNMKTNAEIMHYAIQRGLVG